MPKLPRISDTEAVNALQRLGFQIARQKGSHIVLRHGSCGYVVPNHREMKLGTLAGRTPTGKHFRRGIYCRAVSTHMESAICDGSETNA